MLSGVTMGESSNAGASSSAEGAAVRAPAVPRRGPGEWEPRVLFVDDDPVVRVAAEHLLRRLGLEVDIAADGLAAVEMSAAWPYAAIFMDCQMPEVDGYSTTREIRTQDRVDQG